MTRKNDTEQATPKQVAERIYAGHGLDAIKTRINKMRQQSPVRDTQQLTEESRITRNRAKMWVGLSLVAAFLFRRRRICRWRYA